MALSAGKEPPALLGQQSSGRQARATGGWGGSQPLWGGLPKSSPSTACLQKRKPRQRPALTWITPHQWQGWGPRGRGLLREPGSHEEQRPPRGMGFEERKPKSEGAVWAAPTASQATLQVPTGFIRTDSPHHLVVLLGRVHYLQMGTLRHREVKNKLCDLFHYD